MITQIKPHVNTVTEYIKWFLSRPTVRNIEHLIFLIVTLKLSSSILSVIKKEGIIKATSRFILNLIQSNSLSKQFLNKTLNNEAKVAIEDMFKNKQSNVPLFTSIPVKSLDHNTVLQYLEQLKKECKDVNPEEGKVFAYVYDAGIKHTEFITKANNIFAHTNALSPLAFPSLRRMESELIAMVRNLLNGDKENVCGSLTSGGTESLLLMVKTYRDKARIELNIENPELIMCETAHPAIMKACHYFNVKPILISYNEFTKKINVKEVESKITKNTILIIGSAPQYAHGVIDPIEELSKLALKYKLPLHVDSCIGGLILPFIEKLGYEIPLFDFRVKGVTSISADIHKYGYSFKGASIILYNSHELRKYQFYVDDYWPAGLYISSTILGSRSGGAIASAYASLLALGEEGLLEKTKSIMETCKFIQKEIKTNEILSKYLELNGQPDASIINFKSKNEKILNIMSVADELEKLGDWHIDRGQKPNSIHMTIMPQHEKIAEKFIKDLIKSVEIVLESKDKELKGSAAIYGLLATIPQGTIINEFLKDFLDNMYNL
ncbi:hypothetical protein ABK040_016578 [Willaertia magna]